MTVVQDRQLVDEREVDAAAPGAANPTRPRHTLTIADVCARIEHRAHEVTAQGSLNDGRDECERAVRLGAAGVVVHPTQVMTAATVTRDTGLEVVTAVGWDRVDEVRPTSVLVNEAYRLVNTGATDVAVVGSRARLRASPETFADQVCDVAAAVARAGARCRVTLDTDAFRASDLSRLVALLGHSGVWLVEAGSWGGGRTRLTQLEGLRATVPPWVRLKWCHPVPSVEAMALGIALGVDRFNADPNLSLFVNRAKDRLDACPVRVPVPVDDFLTADELHRRWGGKKGC